MICSRPGFAILIATLLLPGAALGQSKPAPAGTAATPQSEADRMAEARTRYERGIKLYDDGAYDAARSEFERAYALVPSYKLLYNIGLVDEQLSDFVGALKKFYQYLKEGGDQITPERRKEVDTEIQKLKPRIATIEVTVNVPNADVFVDDVPVGKSPLAPIEVNPGKRRISATHPGRLNAAQVVDVAGSDHAKVTIELPAAPKTTVIVDSSRRVPWVGWIATGVLAVGAGAFGYLAIDQKSKLDDAKDAGPNPDPDDLSKRSKRVTTYSILADGLGAAAVIAGGISLYYTIKWGKESPAPPPATGAAPPPKTLRAGVNGTGVTLLGEF